MQRLRRRYERRMLPEMELQRQLDDVKAQLRRATSRAELGPRERYLNELCQRSCRIPSDAS